MTPPPGFASILVWRRSLFTLKVSSCRALAIRASTQKRKTAHNPPVATDAPPRARRGSPAITALQECPPMIAPIKVWISCAIDHSLHEDRATNGRQDGGSTAGTGILHALLLRPKADSGSSGVSRGAFS